MADEVITLASCIANLTLKITETINKVQIETANVVTTMLVVLPKIEKSVVDSNEVIQILEDIRIGSDETLNQISVFSNYSQEQNKATHELAEHIENISNMIGETAEIFEK